MGIGCRATEGMTMKVFLDDARDTPAGWIRAWWPAEVIDLLKTGHVDALSLDHDLGDDARGTGYDVLVWLEAAVCIEGFDPPANITVHSANSPARKRMQAAIAAIERHHAKPITGERK